MKFRHYLESITGVGIYPMASLLIFFLFFTALTIWALRVNKAYISDLKQLPFAANDNDSEA